MANLQAQTDQESFELGRGQGSIDQGHQDTLQGVPADVALLFGIVVSEFLLQLSESSLHLLA